MNEYYTIDSLLKLGGAVTAVTMITAMVHKLFGPRVEPKLIWIAAIVSLALAYFGAGVISDAGWTKWFVAFFNGAMIFLAAVGANELAANKTDIVDITPGSPPKDLSTPPPILPDEGIIRYRVMEPAAQEQKEQTPNQDVPTKYRAASTKRPYFVSWFT